MPINSKCSEFVVLDPSNSSDATCGGCRSLNVSEISLQIFTFVQALLNGTSCCEGPSPECFDDDDCLPLPVNATAGTCVNGECVYTNETIIP